MIVTVDGHRDVEQLTVSHEAAVSTACSAAAMFAEMDTVMFSVMFTSSMIAPMVVTKATSCLMLALDVST